MANFSWLIGGGLALLITATVLVLYWLANRTHNQLARSILEAPWKERAPLHIGSIQLFGTGWLRAILKFANEAGFLVWRILLAIIWFILVVLVLPIWQGLPDAIWAFLVKTTQSIGTSFVDYLPSLGRIIVIVVLFRIVLSVLRWMFEEIRKERIKLRRFHRSWARQTYTLIRFAAVVLAAILIFPLLPGSGTAGFQGIAIFIGALVSIGASTAVGNAVAGIVLTYTRAFDRGDRVKIHDTTGDVVSRTLFVTRVRTIKNEEIAIPNQLVLAGPVINYSNDAGGNGVAIEISIGLGYDVPWRDVHKLLMEAAQVEGVQAEPAPRIYQQEMGDFAVSYVLHAFVEDPKSMLSIRSSVIQQIMDGFAKANIEIVSPEHIAMRDGKPVMVASSHGAPPPEVVSDVPEDASLGDAGSDDDIPVGESAPGEEDPIDDVELDHDPPVGEAAPDEDSSSAN